MSNVVQFPGKKSVEETIVATQLPDVNILDPQEYLKIIKGTLDEDDYRDVLCGIVDYEIYEKIEDELKLFVDGYVARFINANVPA